MILFETPQSLRSQFKVTLERNQFGLSDLVLEETQLRNPYNLQVTIPSRFFRILCLRLKREVIGIFIERNFYQNDSNIYQKLFLKNVGKCTAHNTFSTIEKIDECI